MFASRRTRPRQGGISTIHASDECVKEKEPRAAADSKQDDPRMSRSRSRLFDVDNPGETRVHLNVGGQKHETYVSTLASIPDTRLAWIAERAIKDPRPLAQKREYFFDRNPVVFTHILNYYRTNKLHCPRDVCGPLFEEELNFWGIDEKQIETCCWAKYDEHRDAEEKLQGFSMCDEIEQSSDDEELLGGACSDDAEPDTTSDETGEKRASTRHKMKWKLIKKKIWRTFDDPYSSRPARALGFISLILSVALVAQFCVKTLDYFNDATSPQRRSLIAIEIASVSWFTLDLIMRFSFCPCKVSFLKTLHNWADLISILPFYISFMTAYDSTIRNFKVLYVLRMSRTFRPLKFSYVNQVFTQTLRASSRELYFLIFVLGIQVIVYGSVTYYAEKNVKGTLFTSIPAAFWWAVVTMTTVGYGDMSPSTTPGKFVGCACALSGVLMLALPVSVVASNFSLYNSYAKVKLKLPARTKKRVVDNALKALQVNTFQAPSVEGNSAPRPRYSASIATKMEMTSLIASRRKSPTGEELSEVTKDAERANGTRRFGRRSAHLSVNLVPIKATPELPEMETESAEESEKSQNHETCP